MPFIHIRSLPMDTSQSISSIIQGIARDFSDHTGIEPHHIHATWEFYQPGHYTKGFRVADVQPKANFPLIVDLLTPDFNKSDTIKLMLVTIAESISKRAEFPKNNIFIHHWQVHSEMVFDEGEIVHW